ncbi:MAG: hypothetical protein WD276_04580 [Actinomycetota bacterium]
MAAFYELARDMNATERDRFEQVEGKAWRHLYVLVILLGFGLASSGRTALALMERSPSAIETSFLIVFGVFLLSASSSGLVSVFNFRVSLSLEPPVDQSIEKFAVGSSVDRFHLELGREFMRAGAENRQLADRKCNLLVWNFRLLIVALILGIVLGILYPLLLRGS